MPRLFSRKIIVDGSTWNRYLLGMSIQQQSMVPVPGKQEIRGWVENDLAKQLDEVLPKHIRKPTFLSAILSAFNKTPRLGECTKVSLAHCILDIAAMGLFPTGGQAHLIPYRDNKTNRTNCTLILDYKGIVQLVRRTGLIENIHSDWVGEHDDFDYLFGTGKFLKHKPNYKNRGKPTVYYSYVKLQGGAEEFDIMHISDIEKVRKRSKARDNGPWVTDFDEMAKKTIFKRLAKWLPISHEIMVLLEKDDEALTENERYRAAKPVFSSEPAGEATELPLGEPEPENADDTIPDDETPEEPAQEAPQDPPEKPRRGRKPKTVADQAEIQIVDRIYALMKRDAVDEAEILAILIRRKLCREETDMLVSVSDDVLADLIENWAAVKAQVQINRKTNGN